MVMAISRIKIHDGYLYLTAEDDVIILTGRGCDLKLTLQEATELERELSRVIDCPICNGMKECKR